MQDLSKKIRRIQIHTTQLAADILAGAWHSAFKGRGMEFEEVREYQTGDDIRAIDWNVTARMRHPYIKVFKEERELTVILLVDVSSSSRFGSGNQLKKDLIAEVGAVLAFSAIENHDKVGLILFSDEVEKYIPPQKGVRHVLRVIRELLAFQPKRQGTDLLKALDYVGGILHKSAICFLISDFLCDLHHHEMSIVAKKHDLIAVHVTDPCEEKLPDMSLVQFSDLETEEELTVDSLDSKLKSLLKEESWRRKKEIEETMNRVGAGYIGLSTKLPYLSPLRKFFKLREVKR